MSPAHDHLIAWVRGALPGLSSRIGETHAVIERARDSLATEADPKAADAANAAIGGAADEPGSARPTK
jgi:hypothetical protein